MTNTPGLAMVPGAPDAPAFRLFKSSHGTHLLLVARSQVFDISEPFAESIERGEPEAREALDTLARTQIDPSLDAAPVIPPQSISLNVTSACNLSCSYCYAGGGSFGGAQPGAMSRESAFAAVDRLLDICDRRAPVTIGFLGGEPFLQRELVHDVFLYAAERGAAFRQDVRFSVTTNGTLLTLEDLTLLRAHRCAVTVSVDGGPAVHDQRRHLHGGKPSFSELVRRVQPLLANPGRAEVSARSTVTRDNLDLVAHFDAIRELGFRDLGFSPVRVGTGALVDADWRLYLDANLALARRELARLQSGAESAFSNLTVALRQIHRGAAAPFPCGAGGGYFSVSTRGGWYACHRAIGNSDFELGSSTSLNEERRLAFLRERHVHAQADCRRCWARYLCSGGCHQEAATRSTSSCDFVRGWLDFCLGAYCELSLQRPDWFGVGNRAPNGDPS